jgi:16S rRNA (guanine527-N7)-methyltransferase
MVASEALEVPLSASQADRLLRFERLLADRAIPMGIVASSDRARLRERHVLDCLRAAAEVGDAASAYDLGSGAGLPGLVVAIAAADLRMGRISAPPGVLELASTPRADSSRSVGRVEELSERVELCFSRAFAPCRLVRGRAALSDSGRCLFAGNRPPELPDTRTSSRTTPVLESAGPLVIMGRQ